MAIVEDIELIQKYNRLKDLTLLENVTVMEKRIISVRWLGIFIGFVTVPFLGMTNTLPMYVLISYALLYNILFQFVIIPYKNHWLLKPALLTFGDNFMASVAVYVTGGFTSDFYLIYFLMAVLSAVRFGRREAIISTIFSIVLYALVVFNSAVGLTAITEIILRMGFVVITGIFVGYMGDKSRQIELDLQKELDKAHSQLNKIVAKLNRNIELESVLKTGVQAHSLIDAELSLILMEEASAKFLARDFQESYLKPYIASRKSDETFLDQDVQYLSKLFPELTRISPMFKHSSVFRKKDVIVVNFIADERLAASFSMEEGKTYYLIAVPLMGGESKLGTLYLVKSNDKTMSLRDSQLDVIVLYAHSIASAVTNSLIYTQSKQQAITDSVTGLYNHRFLQETIKLELNKCLNELKPVSLIILDIDSFKQFNDTYGHSIGDLALKSVAQMIQESIHGKGLAARYGGDEFVIILPNMSNEEACKVAEAIRKKAVELKHVHTHKALGSLYISLGVATAPYSGKSPEALFIAADSALYIAKYSGRNVVKSALELSNSELFNEDFPRYLESKKIMSLQKAFSKNSALGIQMIEAFIAAVDAKDHYTFDHSDSVSTYATKLARKMNLSDREIEKIRLGALLHDIGKIGIPDNILNKQGKLTKEEYEIVKQHPVIGTKIIQPIKSLETYFSIIMYHHEWFNGNGYPSGLKGSEIPLEARIVSICDVYDAMTSDRPYRRAIPAGIALQTIEDMVDKQFDPEVWSYFNEMMVEEIGERREEPFNAEVLL